eukprot:c40398_g1_i1.p1 GENE.c40398_g1_i1~~c40398_g1_i1.p1  ORF type:complete len:434 (+),score=68.33 c40398_g1_i1:195-1304(+)
MIAETETEQRIRETLKDVPSFIAAVTPDLFKLNPAIAGEQGGNQDTLQARLMSGFGGFKSTGTLAPPDQEGPQPDPIPVYRRQVMDSAPALSLSLPEPPQIRPTAVFGLDNLGIIEPPASSELEQKLKSLAWQRIREFAPVTPMGKTALFNLVQSLRQFPMLSESGESVASNPTFIINLLDSFKGSMVLYGFYKYLGGETELQAHQSLLQTSASKEVKSLSKATGLFFFANVMVFLLLMSELHEYLNYQVYRPGQKMPTGGQDLFPPAKQDEDKDETERKDSNAIQSAVAKIQDLLQDIKGPVASVLATIAQNCHNIVTFGESGEKQPYTKLAFVWIVFMLTWSAQLTLMSAAMFSLSASMNANHAVFV